MINTSLTFSILSFFYIVLIAIFYFGRKRVKNVETRLYSFLIIINIVGLSIELFSTYLNTKVVGFEIFKMLTLKLIVIYFFTWMYVFSLYIYYVCTKKYGDKQKKIFLFFYLVCFGIMLGLPLYKNMSDGFIKYTYGPEVNFLYITYVFALLCWIALIVKNRKELKKKKLIPFAVFLILELIVAIIQTINPTLLLLGSLLVFVTLLMYFTIENPDVKMIQELEVAREQADKANRAKTDFLSSMSHEIRTPLNAIVGFSDCIMDAQDLGEAKENAKDIVNASQTLLEIVNGILDISKIEAGKIEIVNSKYNAPETFLELAKLITPKMKEKGLDFTYNIAPDLPLTLFGDHANIKKIVTNLLSNACKYTDRGYVRYEVNCVNTNNVSKLIISVEDSGRGIKKENIDKMFTKFQRLDEDRNTTIEGTGLGLAITKQLIELMGGRIIVHTVYGQGSKFTVVLNQKIETGEVSESRKVKTTLDLQDVRILLVDDTELNLKVACKLLQKYNANQLVTCNSGFECLEKIQRGEIYDLILLDDMMPKMSGVETLKKLKEIPGFDIPTIALTANAITGMREKYLADGFDDYLAKPIEKDQLIQVVNQVLGRSITEEISIPSKEEIINTKMNGPMNPSIRSEEIPNVESYDMAEEERRKKEIIPVEDNIEEMLGNTLQLNLSNNIVNPTEEIETLEEESQPIETIPVVDITIPTRALEKDEIYDRSYLEKNGVDVNHALELLGDMEMYNMTIHDFMSEVENKWGRIVKYRDLNDMENYAIEVHSLKSDCKYLGFMILADVAYEHELKSKENDSVFVKEHFYELEEQYEKVLEIARTYVEHNKVD